MAWLLIETPDGRRRQYLLGESDASFGRAKANAVPLQDAKCSSFHCRVQPDNRGHFLLVDARSRNGTFLNGEQLDGGDSCRLREGDVALVGQTRVTYTETPPQDTWERVLNPEESVASLSSQALDVDGPAAAATHTDLLVNDTQPISPRDLPKGDELRTAAAALATATATATAAMPSQAAGTEAAVASGAPAAPSRPGSRSAIGGLLVGSVLFSAALGAISSYVVVQQDLQIQTSQITQLKEELLTLQALQRQSDDRIRQNHFSGQARGDTLSALAELLRLDDVLRASLFERVTRVEDQVAAERAAGGREAEVFTTLRGRVAELEEQVGQLTAPPSELPNEGAVGSDGEPVGREDPAEPARATAATHGTEPANTPPSESHGAG